MFNVGDLAVYPAHGVGLIEGIEEKSISGEEHIFYVIPGKTPNKSGLGELFQVMRSNRYMPS
jgi:RNA polymerase-interacting CarD/CdnL/TRCF family regulator